MNEQKLMQAILDSPEDDAPRLQYAACLDATEQGERAELIRVQIELARLEEAAAPDADPTAQEDRLYARAEELLAEHAWHLSLPDIPGIDWGGGPHYGFERGFMCRLSVADADAFCTQLGRAFEVAPITEVTFSGASDADLAAIVASPHLSRLTGLRITFGEVGDKGAVAVALCPCATRLRSLTFFCCKVGPAGAAALAQSPHLAGLRELALNTCPLGSEGARAILESSTWAHLELVDFRGCFPKPKNRALLIALRERFGGGLEV
jgi:uncharacterized protein (TIGR02996 family)